MDGRPTEVEFGVEGLDIILELEVRDLLEAVVVEFERLGLVLVGCSKPRFARTTLADGSDLEGGSDLEFPSLTGLIEVRDRTEGVPLRENRELVRSWSIDGTRGVPGGVKSQS